MEFNLEDIVGESAEDMGVEDQIESITCGRCGKVCESINEHFICHECEISRSLWDINYAN